MPKPASKPADTAAVTDDEEVESEVVEREKSFIVDDGSDDDGEKNYVPQSSRTAEGRSDRATSDNDEVGQSDTSVSDDSRAPASDPHDSDLTDTASPGSREENDGNSDDEYPGSDEDPGSDENPESDEKPGSENKGDPEVEDGGDRGSDNGGDTIVNTSPRSEPDAAPAAVPAPAPASVLLLLYQSNSSRLQEGDAPQLLRRVPGASARRTRGGSVLSALIGASDMMARTALRWLWIVFGLLPGRGVQW